MAQTSILPKGQPGFKRAMLNYYGFTPNQLPWPLDGDGVMHLLGDGDTLTNDHLLELVANQDDPVSVSYSSFTQAVIWAEVLKVGFPGELSPRYIYREISESDANSFDPTSDGFGAKVLSQATAQAYIQSFGHVWRDFQTDELVDETAPGFAGYFALDDEWHGAGSIFGTSGLSNIGSGSSHYWNPYQGSVFFTSLGADGEYLVWRPFIVHLTYQDDSVEELPPRWAWKATGVARSSSDPPLDQSGIETLFTDLTSAGWTFGHSFVTDPNVKSWTATAVHEFVASRFVQLRVRHVTNPNVVLYSGTRGGLVNLSESTSTVDVVKQYEDESETSEGTVPTRVVSMSTREGGEVISTFYDNPALSRLIPLYNGWDISGVPLNYATMSIAHDVTYPFWSYITSRGGLTAAITEAHLCAFAQYDPWAVHIGWGSCQRRYQDGDEGNKSDPYSLLTVYRDTLPLRVEGPAGQESLAALYETECIPPEKPDTGWLTLRATSAENASQTGWVTLGSQDFKYTALLSDDGDNHDPRANTATDTLEEFLALGDGLCYEGSLGSIPRPRSGATGTLLGREIEGDDDLAIDVVTIPDGHMAVMVKGGTVEAWTRVDDTTNLVWSDTLAASIPPLVLEQLGANPKPALDLRFLLADWPTPTGALTVGEYTLVLTPKGDEHRRYSWLTPDGKSVSPPFLLHLGWAGRFPTFDPRSPPLYFQTSGGGGES